MERMPSASEMERYKQEMMSMYRRANPNARTTGQAVTTVSETVAPPRQASGSNADQSAQNSAGSATTTPVREQSNSGMTDIPCDDISAPSTQNIQPSIANRQEAGSAPRRRSGRKRQTQTSPSSGIRWTIFPAHAFRRIPRLKRHFQRMTVPAAKATSPPARVRESRRQRKKTI